MNEGSTEIASYSAEPDGGKEISHKKKFLVFKLSRNHYCFPLLAIKEIIAIPKITPLPNVPDFFMGLLNLRGQIITVIDLRKKMGASKLDFNPMENSIIISEIQGLTIGCVVDEVLAVRGYAESDIDTPQNADSSDHHEAVTGVAKEQDSDNLTLVLDLVGVLGQKTIEEIKKQHLSKNS